MGCHEDLHPLPFLSGFIPKQELHEDHLSLLPEVVVLQDEHVTSDLRRLAISVTRCYVTKCTAR